MEFEKDILNCIAVLKSGGTILYPTDTIWGLGCDATNENAVAKIYDLKKRPDEKTMIVLVPDKKEVLRFVASPNPAIFDYLDKTKKPTTVIYENAIGLAQNLIGKEGDIALRICKEEFCRHLLKRFRKPIVSTSANISGSKPPANFSEISDTVKRGVDFIVQHRQDETAHNEASSIIKWKAGNIIIIRP